MINEQELPQTAAQDVGATQEARRVWIEPEIVCMDLTTAELGGSL